MFLVLLVGSTVAGNLLAAESGCFQEPYLLELCCSTDRGASGDPACWRSLLGDLEPENWPNLFERCCVWPAFTKHRSSVLVPDVLAGLLEPTAQNADLPEELPIRLVRTGLGLDSNIRFNVPANSTIMFNIGAHNFLEREWIDALKKPEVQLFCFEPDRTNFQRLRLWAQSTLSAEVGSDALARLHILPCAVGPGPERFAWLRRSDFAEGQCNSLLPGNPEHTSEFAKAGCGGDTSSRELVMVVTLAELLQRLPTRAQVELLKVDAQGLDLAVVQSGGTFLGQTVQRIQMEVQEVPEGSTQLMYMGMHTKASALQGLATIGFGLEDCGPTHPSTLEQDCIWVRK